MYSDKDVINLIDRRATRLTGKAKGWLSGLGVLGPVVFAFCVYLAVQGPIPAITKQFVSLLLQVGISAFASLCFVNIYSRAVQRRQGRSTKTSMAFLFVSIASLVTAVGGVTGLALNQPESASLIQLSMNLVAGLLLTWSTFKVNSDQELDQKTTRKVGSAVFMAAIAMPLIVHQFVGQYELMKWLTIPAIPILAFVGFNQAQHYRQQREPMRLAILAVAIGLLVSHIYLLGSSTTSMMTRSLWAKIIVLGALLSPTCVIVAKDAISARRSLPAQVRLTFNSVIGVIMMGTIMVVFYINEGLVLLESSSAMTHFFAIQQRCVILIASAIIGSTCVSMLLATTRMRRFLSNIQHLVMATRELARGHYHGLMYENSEDELGVLNIAFSAMAERLYLQNRELDILAHVMDGTSDPVVVLSPDRHVVYTNRSFTQKTGWERREVIGSLYDTMFSEGESRRRLASYCEAIEGNQTSAGELNIDIRGGGRLASFVTISPVEHQDQTTYFVAVHHDLGPVKQLEQERADFTSSLMSVHRIAQSVVESLEVEEVQRRAVVGLELAFGIKARIWLTETSQYCSSCEFRSFCEDQSECLELYGTQGATLVCHPINSGFLGNVLEKRSYQICEDPNAESELFECAPVDHQMHGARCAFPLMAAGRTLGILEVALPKPEDRARIELIELLAHTLAEGICNARNHERLSRQALRLQTMAAELEDVVSAEKQQANELRRLNDRLIEADRLRHNFLSTTSHELRSPISGVMGYLQLIIDDMAEDRDEEMEFILGAHEQAQNLLEIVNDVLDLAKIDSGQTKLNPELLGVDSVFGESEAAMEKTAAEKGLELSYQNCSPETEVWADYIRMNQILTIIVGNAVKFSDAGAITVSAQPQEDGGIVEFRVVDEGVGIAQEDQERIMDAFVQADGGESRRFGGSGLGLTLARELLSMMGGTIRVESKGLGEGTTVIFTLPAQAPFDQAEVVGDFKGRTAIVVDSDPKFIETVTDALSPFGTQIVVASTAEEAIDLTHDLRPAWVLSELTLPHNNHPKYRTGIDLGRAIQSIEEFTVGFFLVTSQTELIDFDALERDEIKMMHKPVAQETIEDTLSLADMKTAFAMRPRILVVDSNPNTPQSIRSALENTPFEVEFTTRAEACIENMKSETGRADVLLVDLSLPGASLFEFLDVAGDRLNRQEVGIFLLHSDQEGLERDVAAFEHFHNQIDMIPRSMIDDSPQQFIQMLVNSVAGRSHIIHALRD